MEIQLINSIWCHLFNVRERTWNFVFL